MVHHIKEIGPKALQMARAPSVIKTVIFMKDSGRITSALVMVNTSTRMVQHTLVIGKMTCKMDREWRFGLKAHAMKVRTKTERNRASVSTYGLTDHFTQATGMTIRLTALVNTCGKMVENTMASGKITTCQGTAFIFIMTVSLTKANSSTTKRRATAITSGLMAASTKATGTAASSMESVYSKTRRREKRSTACGSKASDSSGSTSKQLTKSTSNDTTTANSSRRKKVSTAYRQMRRSIRPTASSSR